MPRERAISGDMAVMVEASNASVPGDDMYHANNGITLTLPTIDRYGPPSRWIEVFSVGTQEFDYVITADQPFVQISKPKGTIAPTVKEPTSDTRVYLSIDWDACPEGDGKITFNISSSRDYGLGNQYNMPSVYLPFSNRRVPEDFKGYVESGKCISIEASHYSRLRGAADDGPRYRTLQGYGKTLAGVELVPFDADSQTPSTGPVLEYDFFTFTSTNKANITVRLGPSLNTNPKQPLQYAVAVDDAEPEVRQYITDLPKSDPPAEDWYVAAANNGWDITTEANITQGGHVLRLWALEPGVIFEKVIVDLGGVEDSYLGPPESTRVD